MGSESQKDGFLEASEEILEAANKMEEANNSLAKQGKGFSISMSTNNFDI